MPGYSQMIVYFIDIITSSNDSALLQQDLTALDMGGDRVGIKPGFYHKAQPGGFYEGGFWGFYVGFINLKVYLITPATTCYLSFSVQTALV